MYVSYALFSKMPVFALRCQANSRRIRGNKQREDWSETILAIDSESPTDYFFFRDEESCAPDGQKSSRRSYQHA